MTKTLTEQWREGTLPEGLYYIEGKGNYDIALIRNKYCPILTSPYCEDNVFESEFLPVAPVPSYDEYQDIIQQNVNQESAIETYIEDIKRLQEQLKEANEVIDTLRTYDFTIDDENAESYQVKWNVKAERFYKNRKLGVK